MAYTVMAYIVMAYIVMAYTVMAAGPVPTNNGSCARTCAQTRAHTQRLDMGARALEAKMPFFSRQKMIFCARVVWTTTSRRMSKHVAMCFDMRVDMRHLEHFGLRHAAIPAGAGPKDIGLYL